MQVQALSTTPNTEHRETTRPNTAAHKGTSSGRRDQLYKRRAIANLSPPKSKESQSNHNGQPPNRQFSLSTPVSQQLQADIRTRHPAPRTQLATVCRASFQLPSSLTLAQQLLGNKYSSKSLPSYPLFEPIFLFKWHNNSTTLSNESNPFHAWGTYASRRAHAYISKDLAPQIQYSLRIIQFLNSYTILYKKISSILHDCILKIRMFAACIKNHDRTRKAKHAPLQLQPLQ